MEEICLLKHSSESKTTPRFLAEGFMNGVHKIEFGGAKDDHFRLVVVKLEEMIPHPVIYLLDTF